MTNEPKAEETARDILAERGAPEGAPTPKPKGKGWGGARAGSGPKKGRKPKPKTTEKPEEPISEEEIQGYAVLSGVVWNTAARVFKFDTLTKEEEARLGSALAPVVRKYGPGMDEWMPELTLAVVLVGLMEEKGVWKKREKKTADEDNADLDLDRGRAEGHP
jgi:hypothetical protein